MESFSEVLSLAARHSHHNSSTSDSSPLRTASISLVTGLIIFVTTFGNMFVIAAFMADRRIRAVIGNWFILNLSICDLLTGVVVLPFNTHWVIVGSWRFGEAFCKLWLILDFSVTHVSVLSIIFISLDRYWMVTKTARYHAFLSKKRVLTMIITAWVTVVLYYTAVALLWAPITNERPFDFNEDCELDAVFNIYFTIVQILLEMACPLVVIVYLNAVVYTEIKHRSRAFASRRPTRAGPMLFMSRRHVQPSADDTQSHYADTGLARLSTKQTADVLGDMEACTSCKDLTSRSGDFNNEGQTTDNLTHPSVISSVSDGDGISRIIEATCSHQNGCCDDDRELSPATETSSSRGAAEQSRKQCTFTEQSRNVNLSTQPSTKRESQLPDPRSRTTRNEFKKHRKAAITLAVLVSVFVLCWLPYHITSTINVICRGCVGDLAWEIVNYLLWCNATLNPFLYAITNVRFRRNFSRFLGVRKLLYHGSRGFSDTV